MIFKNSQKNKTFQTKFSEIIKFIVLHLGIDF